MEEYIIKEDTLTDIADAIRVKRNITQELTPQEMSVEIMKITTGDGSGKNGATFIPSIGSEGNLSWSNDKGLENPTPINIKGPKGATGSHGLQGPQGPQDEPGLGGLKGADGTMFFEDLTEEQKATLKGDKGDTSPEGPVGAPGVPGEDGYTPQRGVDYWTEEDRQEILNEIGGNVTITPISDEEIAAICVYGPKILLVNGVEF